MTSQVPSVATSYHKSSDGKTYTFNLRHNAKWSNGDTVTAKDFVTAWR
ncbi:ABC transporter substrate-binding protein, partial [Lactobacillus delbrueckii subsp. bulgaricus]